MDMDRHGASMRASACLDGRAGTLFQPGFAGHYRIECIATDGAVKWTDEVHNLVVNSGLDDILERYWKGSGYTAAHFIGPTDGGPTIAATDTIAAHAGWLEVTAYSEATRQNLILGSVAGQSVDNSASLAVFTANGPATIGGIFIATDSAKSGALGALISVGAFSGGDRAVTSGDTLNITITNSATAV